MLKTFSHDQSPQTFLLQAACPSIQYRLRLELLGEPRTDPIMLALQSQILHNPAVQEVIGWQLLLLHYSKNQP